MADEQFPDTRPGTGPPLLGVPPETTDDTSDGSDHSVRWWQRWWLKAALAGLVIVALTIAVIVQQVRIAELNSQVDRTQERLGAVRDTNRELSRKVADRQSQREADEAAVARVEAEEQAAERKATEREEAAEAARLAEQAREAEESAREAEEAQQREAAEQELRNTLPGDGIVAIGAEKNPGTYRTDGPGRSSSCYYAVLNAPSGPGISNIITNNNISGPAIVVVAQGQFFESSGCQSWKRQ